MIYEEAPFGKGGQPEIELIINLTTPDVHAEIGLAALRAGKSVYNEKPLAINPEGVRSPSGLCTRYFLGEVGCKLAAN